MQKILDDRDVNSKGTHLDGKTIDVVVSGGIACIETPKVIRELRRYGASVRVFMTPAVSEFVKPLVFEWASKNPVVTNLSGSAEHITHSDAILICPATLDFLSKIACGIADSAALTLVQSAFGRIPLFIAPSMHVSLEANPIYQENLKKIKSVSNVHILPPLEEEGKMKLISHEHMVAEMCHVLSSSVLSTLSMTLLMGPTRSAIDDVRFVSNRSRGTLGAHIADELFRRGAALKIIHGPIETPLSSWAQPVVVETAEQMRAALHQDFDQRKTKVIIFAAAVLDYEVAEKISGKISSQNPIQVTLKPIMKLIQTLPSSVLKVGFKLESHLTPDELKKRAIEWAQKNNCAIVVANRLEDISDQKHRALIWSKKFNDFLEAHTKQEIAVQLCNLLEKSV